MSSVPNVIALKSGRHPPLLGRGRHKAIRRKSLSDGSQEDVLLGLTDKPMALLVLADFIYWIEWAEQPPPSMDGAATLEARETIEPVDGRKLTVDSLAPSSPETVRNATMSAAATAIEALAEAQLRRGRQALDRPPGLSADNDDALVD